MLWLKESAVAQLTKVFDSWKGMWQLEQDVMVAQ
jgi:hypothetical protein